jgi:prolyl-tRNA editing enzyme YbaK/EbsC (Cys-tRNA(Pro) deacylase)
MHKYEKKLKKIIKENGIMAEHFSFNQSCHSVEDAARTVGAEPQDFIKSICLVDKNGRVIVAIVKGEDRVSTSRVGKALNIEKPRVASPNEILGLTGFPVGGTPGFGFEATYLVDPHVLEKNLVYLGGGSDSSLLRMSPKELLKANGAKVVRIRK